MRADSWVKAKKIDQALDVMFSKDPWAKDHYKNLFDDSSSDVSAEKSVVLLREVEAKARELGIRIPAPVEAGFRDDLNFFQTASRRSCTIVKNTLAMMEPGSSAPVALIIGAAHTPKVVELIKASRLSYVVVSPLSLAATPESEKLTPAMYHRKMDSKSVDEAGMLGAILDGRKKPPVMVGRQVLQSKAEIYASLDLITAAAAGGETVPSEELRATLQQFKSISIDWASFKKTRDGDQVRVMYKVIARTSDIDPQQTKTLWVSGWHEPPPPNPPPVSSPSDDDSGMEKLLLAMVKEDRNERPIPKPSKKVAIVQVSTNTRAAFATNPALLDQVSIAR
jgi:hypothetical protein